MATNLDNDDDSFIILGSSPGTSLDMKYSAVNGDTPLDKSQLEDAMKDLSIEANMAFKAHFKLADCPSPASMMVASNIVTEDKSTEELQKQFGELLDENVILKETLKQNNHSMKEQFMLIASCQEDMLNAHKMHKEKFDETRELVEKLRQENKILKQEMVKLNEEAVSTMVNNETGEYSKSGPPSAVEFVSSPDDDTIYKLTAQLELIEKQRRQVIVENEKLTWQKESLEHIADATAKERDELKEKLKDVELQLSTKDSEFAQEVSNLKTTIQDLHNKLQSSTSLSSMSTEEVKKRDSLIRQLESKVSNLQSDLKNAQLKILDLENVKLEFTKHKSNTSETVKMYKEQLQDLTNRLKEAQTTVFQPVRFSLSVESESSSEYASFMSNVKLYDRTLKHLSELLNTLSNGTTDSLLQTLGLAASLHDFKLGKTTADRVKAGLGEMKQNLEKQYNSILNNIGQVKGTLSIFEGIFKDYNEILKKALSKQENKSNAPNVETLTAALVARGHELQTVHDKLKKLANEKDDCDLLKAQMELYKSDFEAEREAREKMASEKENILADFRTTQKRNQELVKQLEAVRKLNPGVYQAAAAAAARGGEAARPQAATPRAPRTPALAPPPATANATGNMVYKCPKCMRFSSDQMQVMDDHFDFCLDDIF